MAERISVPELRNGEHIKKWKPLYDTATAGIRVTEGGGKKALQILPAHISCGGSGGKVRDWRYRDSFPVLIQNLDSPSDPHRALQTLCRTD